MGTKKLIKKILKKSQPKDFWISLSETTKGIKKGLADIDAGRYTPIKPVIERLMSE